MLSHTADTTWRRFLPRAGRVRRDLFRTLPPSPAIAKVLISWLVYWGPRDRIEGNLLQRLDKTFSMLLPPECHQDPPPLPVRRNSAFRRQWSRNVLSSKHQHQIVCSFSKVLAHQLWVRHCPGCRRYNGKGTWIVLFPDGAWSQRDRS